MATRRNLVSRARLNENSNASPAQRRRRDEEPAQPTGLPPALPPYEPPSCPLTASGRIAFNELRINHNYGRYQKHLEHSKKMIPSAIGETNERLLLRREKVARAAEKRRLQEKGETVAELDEAKLTLKYGKRVEQLTAKAEQAMRDLIDYSDELVMQDAMMAGIIEAIPAAPTPRPPLGGRPRQRQPRNEDSDEDAEEEEEQEEEDQPDVPVLSAAKLLEKAKEDYARDYASKSMLQRYDNNDYGTFKRVLHESLNPGEDAPKPPKATKWFPQDSTQQENGEAEESEESDDDVYISGAKDDFKCPLSLGKFREPFTNNGCKHTYEKKTIIDFINAQGTAFSSTQGRGQRSGKQIMCVVIGCENMLKIDDFYDDAEVLRKMKRANRQAAYEEEEDDDDEEDQAPRGTQETRPEELDDESDESEKGTSRKNIARVKKERQSRGRSSALRRGAGSSDAEMDDA